MTTKEQFISELEPLLLAAEQAIVAGDNAARVQLSMRVFNCARKYADQLDPVEFRAALNSPTANAIAERLGVKPRVH